VGVAVLVGVGVAVAVAVGVGVAAPQLSGDAVKFTVFVPMPALYLPRYVAVAPEATGGVAPSTHSQYVPLSCTPDGGLNCCVLVPTVRFRTAGLPGLKGPLEPGGGDLLHRTVTRGVAPPVHWTRSMPAPGSFGSGVPDGVGDAVGVALGQVTAFDGDAGALLCVYR